MNMDVWAAISLGCLGFLVAELGNRLLRRQRERVLRHWSQELAKASREVSEAIGHTVPMFEDMGRLDPSREEWAEFGAQAVRSYQKRLLWQAEGMELFGEKEGWRRTRKILEWTRRRPKDGPIDPPAQM